MHTSMAEKAGILMYQLHTGMHKVRNRRPNPKMHMHVKLDKISLPHFVVW